MNLNLPISLIILTCWAVCASTAARAESFSERLGRVRKETAEASEKQHKREQEQKKMEQEENQKRADEKREKHQKEKEQKKEHSKTKK